MTTGELQGKAKITMTNKKLQDTIQQRLEKDRMAAQGLPMRPFKPLTVAPHPRQRDIDAYNQLPSQYAPSK